MSISFLDIIEHDAFIDGLLPLLSPSDVLSVIWTCKRAHSRRRRIIAEYLRQLNTLSCKYYCPQCSLRITNFKGVIWLYLFSNPFERCPNCKEDTIDMTNYRHCFFHSSETCKGFCWDQQTPLSYNLSRDSTLHRWHSPCPACGEQLFNKTRYRSERCFLQVSPPSPPL
jgi:hypothetical protein